MTEQTHLCSAAYRCKSETCCHAKPHTPNDCDSNAPCGCWPNNPNFQPTVRCIEKEMVKQPEDCNICEAKEAKGHHPGECLSMVVAQRDHFRNKSEFMQDQITDLSKALNELMKVRRNTVIMPKRLTAENGAKAALIGEFRETDYVKCPDCCDYEGTCETCGGDGIIQYMLPVTWTTIKAIYKKAVEVLGK